MILHIAKEDNLFLMDYLAQPTYAHRRSTDEVNSLVSRTRDIGAPRWWRWVELYPLAVRSPAWDERTLVPTTVRTECMQSCVPDAHDCAASDGSSRLSYR